MELRNLVRESMEVWQPLLAKLPSRVSFKQILADAEALY